MGWFNNKGTNFSVANIPNMSGKVVIVTGASAGIGKVSALELARKGAHVILACRGKEKAEKVVADIKAEANTDKVEYMNLDLMSLQSVDKFVAEFRAKSLPLHVLLNNAGIMAAPYALSKDGIESQFATNHVAHFRLTTQLLDLLETSSPSRVVNVSSMAHNWTYSNGVNFDTINEEKGYSAWLAYGQSKLSNILFTRELSSRLESKGVNNVYVNAVHPGVVKTELGRSMSMPGFVQSLFSFFQISPEQGALTSLFAATSPDIETQNVRGKYFVPFGKEEVPSKKAQDNGLAKQLWEFTEKLIHEKLSSTNQQDD